MKKTVLTIAGMTVLAVVLGLVAHAGNQYIQRPAHGDQRLGIWKR
jgi:hypothetical protein